MRVHSWTLVVLSAWLVWTPHVVAQSDQAEIRIVVRAFTSNALRTRTAIARSLPQGNGWMLAGPSPIHRCFLARSRTFSNDLASSSELATDVTLTIDKHSVTVRPSLGNSSQHRSGTVTQLECLSGKKVAERPGQIVASGSTTQQHRTAPNVVATREQSLVRVVLSAALLHPFVESVHGAPIEYSVALDYDTGNGRLSYTAHTSRFPAYEALVQINGGAVRPLFHHEASATSFLRVYDTGMRLAPKVARGVLQEVR